MVYTLRVVARGGDKDDAFDFCVDETQKIQVLMEAVQSKYNLATPPRLWIANTANAGHLKAQRIIKDCVNDGVLIEYEGEDKTDNENKRKRETIKARGYELQSRMKYKDRQQVYHDIKDSIIEWNPAEELLESTVDLSASYASLRARFQADAKTSLLPPEQPSRNKPGRPKKGETKTPPSKPPALAIIPPTYPVENVERDLYPGIQAVLEAAAPNGTIVVSDGKHTEAGGRYPDFLTGDGAIPLYSSMHGAIEAKKYITKGKLLSSHGEDTRIAIGQISDWAYDTLIVNQPSRKYFTSAMTDLKRWQFVQVSIDLTKAKKETRLKYCISRVYNLCAHEDSLTPDLDGVTELPDEMPEVFPLISRLITQQKHEASFVGNINEFDADIDVASSEESSGECSFTEDAVSTTMKKTTPTTTSTKQALPSQLHHKKTEKEKGKTQGEKEKFVKKTTRTKPTPSPVRQLHHNTGKEKEDNSDESASDNEKRVTKTPVVKKAEKDEKDACDSDSDDKPLPKKKMRLTKESTTKNSTTNKDKVKHAGVNYTSCEDSDH